ncbi:MAG: hypothetical protein ABH863_05075 [Candidatus Micrarchaeota archaeon]
MAKHTKKKAGFKVAGFEIKQDYILALLLIVSVALYVQFKHMLFGVASLLLLLALFLRDALPASSDSKSIKSSLYELGFALAAALAVWYGLGFILQTPTPIDVVTSCSMLPALDRGDLIILQGGEIKALEVEVPRTVDFRDFTTSKCNITEIATGIQRSETCTTGLTINGKTYPFDTSGDIVVYEPNSAFRDLGLVVHRTVMKLKFKDKVVYLIKGDNNPAPDIFGITQSFAEEEQIKGRTIMRVPYIGYLKLFLSLQFDEPANCKYIISQ